MSFKNGHQRTQPSPVNSRPPDRTLASYQQRQSESVRRQSVHSQDSLAAGHVEGQQSNPRALHVDPSNGGKNTDHRCDEAGPSRQYDTSSQIPSTQYSRMDRNLSRGNTMEPPDASYSRSQSQPRSGNQRHPNLSLDTHHLPNQPHPFLSRPSASEDNSPGFSPSVNPNLNSDLHTLRVGLQSVWDQTSKHLHFLHTTLAAKVEQTQSHSATLGQVQILRSQCETLSREVERLRVENKQLAADKIAAEETKRQAVYERGVLGIANERLWEDKIKLEGEKRELKVKLDARVEYIRLCQDELAKKDERKSNPNTSQADERPARVKMEVDEAGVDQIDGVQIPLAQIEEVIYSRLKHEADDFGREIHDVYQNLAKAQTRVTELETLLKRYANIPNPNQNPQPLNEPPARQAIPPSAQQLYARHHLSAVSPITPQTALLSSVSEIDRSEFPFTKSWNDKSSGSHIGRHQNTNRGDGAQLLPNNLSNQRRVSGSTIPARGMSPPNESHPRRYSAPTDTGSTSGGGSANASPAMDSMYLRTGVGARPTIISMQMASTSRGVGQDLVVPPQPLGQTSQAPHPRPSNSSHEMAQRQPMPSSHPRQHPPHNAPPPHPSGQQQAARDHRQYIPHLHPDSQNNSSRNAPNGQYTSANHTQRQSLPPPPHAQQLRPGNPHAQQPHAFEPPVLPRGSHAPSPDVQARPQYQHPSQSHHALQDQRLNLQQFPPHPGRHPPAHHQQRPQQPPSQHPPPQQPPPQQHPPQQPHPQQPPPQHHPPQQPPPQQAPPQQAPPQQAPPQQPPPQQPPPQHHPPQHHPPHAQPSSQDTPRRPSVHPIHPPPHPPPPQLSLTYHPHVYPPQTHQKGVHSRSSSMNNASEGPRKRARTINNQDEEMRDVNPKPEMADGVGTIPPPEETPGHGITSTSSSETISAPTISSPSTTEKGPTASSGSLSTIPPSDPVPSSSKIFTPPPSSAVQNRNSSIKIEHPVLPSNPIKEQDPQPSSAPQQPPPPPPPPPPGSSVVQVPQPLTESIVKASDELSPDEKIMLKSLSRVLGKKKDMETGMWKCTICKQDKMSQPVSFGEDTPVGVVTQHVKIIHRQFWKELKAAEGAESSFQPAANPPPQS